jgi:hypothetical protein
VNPNILEYEDGGRQFIIYDMSVLNGNDDYKAFTVDAKNIITKYPEKSIYALTTAFTVFDSNTRIIVSEWILFNKPYIAASALVGFDGIKRMFLKEIFRNDRPDIKFFFHKKDAVEWLKTATTLVQEKRL